MAVSKQLLSGSTSGRPVKVAATSTPGTTIHTAHATDKDEIYLVACNTDSSERLLTIEWGGVTSPDDKMQFTLAPNETVQIVGGLILTGGLLVKAFAAAANVVTLTGFVNRIS